MRRLVWVLSLLVVFGLASCKKGPDPDAPYLLVPMQADGSLMDQQAPVVVVKEGVSVEVAALSNPQRAAWLRERLDLDEDPLLRRGLAELFLTFRMAIRSTGTLPVHLETQSIRLWPDNSGASTGPLDTTRTYELLRPDKESSPEAADVKNFMRGLYDGPIYLAAGQGREGLLLIKAPSTSATRMMLELPFIQVGATSHRIRIPFSKQILDDPKADNR